MDEKRLAERIVDLARELGQFSGFRSLWLSPEGELCHSEPDEELEVAGFLHLCCVMQPSRSELEERLSRLLLGHEIPSRSIGAVSNTNVNSAWAC